MKNLIHPEPAMMRVRKHPVQRSISTLGLALLFALSLSAQKTWHVAAAVQGGGQTGQDWPNAFSDLQSALALAQSGDAIWVAQGTYYPTATADRGISFALKPGVRLYGGFAGAETELSQRDFDQHPSILSGNIGSATTHKDNSYSIVTGQGLDSTACLDGFALRYAYADAQDGSALFLRASASFPLNRPLIRNCRFEYNYSLHGAALWCKSDAGSVVSPVVQGCIFRFNRAQLHGGAVQKYGPSPTDIPLVLEDCIFTDNRAMTGNGGAIAFWEMYGAAFLRRCQFERDSAPTSVSGAVYYAGLYGPGYLQIDSCNFIANYSDAGACLTYDELLSGLQGVYVPFTCKVNACVFDKNQTRNNEAAVFYFEGGIKSAMRLYLDHCLIKDSRNRLPYVCLFETYANSDVYLSIRNTKFIGNTNYYYPGAKNPPLTCYFYGTGSKGKIEIDNCLFARNGAGIEVSVGTNCTLDTWITNSTFYHNNDIVINKSWSALHNDSTFYNKVHIYNCIFDETTTLKHLFSDNNEDLWHMEGYDIDHILANYSTNSQVFGAGPHVLFKKDPMFVDPAHDDFRLRPCSPAVNYGSNPAAEAAGLVTDLDGHPRIFDGTVDLGAYEEQDTCGMVPVTEIPGGLAAPAGLFPNPAEPGAQVTVVLPETEGENAIHWRLEDAMGRLVASGVAGEPVFATQAPAIAGVYFFVAERGSALGVARLAVR